MEMCDSNDIEFKSAVLKKKNYIRYKKTKIDSLMNSEIKSAYTMSTLLNFKMNPIEILEIGNAV